MKDFRKLTVRGQARRLRSLAIEALKHYDLEIQRIRLVSNDFNGIFRLDATDREKFILRVILPEGGHDAGSVCAEMDWLNALNLDTNLSIPNPLKTKNGEWYSEITCPGIAQPRMCVIFSWVPGSDLAQHLNANSIFELGKLTAQLHLHAEKYKIPISCKIPVYDSPFPFGGPVVLFAEENERYISPKRRSLFQEAQAWVEETINTLRKDGKPMRVIHSDLHQWNVRWYRGALSPIDFEDLMWGWPVQDIGHTFYYLFDREDYDELRIDYKLGYSEIRCWPERNEREVDAFIAARGLDLTNFVLQDPNPDWASKAEDIISIIERRLRVIIDTKD